MCDVVIAGDSTVALHMNGPCVLRV